MSDVTIPGGAFLVMLLVVVVAGTVGRLLTSLLWSLSLSLWRKRSR